jgi:hypothetical protein
LHQQAGKKLVSDLGFEGGAASSRAASWEEKSKKVAPRS